MPQAVQSLLSVPSQPFQSSAPQARQSDASSFRDSLEQAQNRDSQPAQATDQPKPSKADAKATVSGKASGKKAGSKGQATAPDKNSENTAELLKRPADAHPDQTANPDASPQDQQQTPGDSPKKQPQEKKSAEVQAAAADSAAIVQIQANADTPVATPAPAQPASLPAPSSSEPTPGQTRAGSQTQKGIVAKAIDPKAGQKQADAAQQPDAGQDAPAQTVGTDTTAQTQEAMPSTQKGKPALAIQPRKAAAPANAQTDSGPANAQAATAVAGGAVAVSADADAPASPTSTEPPASPAAPRPATRLEDDSLLKATTSQPPASNISGHATFKIAAADQPDSAPAPEAQFAEANHAKIVSGIQGQLLPNGGSMQIRLDPPELGAMHVRVEMRDGVMTASFETTNDQATKLLSHSLSNLKTALEAQGVTVDKLQVRQSPKEQSSQNSDRQPDRSQDHAHQQEQQRKEMVRRMWRRLMKGNDPLDLVA